MQESDIKAAVKAFWKARKAGTQSDEHPKAFLDLIATDLRQIGWTDVRVARVGRDPRATVGGYFRHSKKWDVVCWHEGAPKIAVEVKTQAGSYANNENNRYEEALGNALDLRAKYRDGVGIGFLFVICEEEESLRKRPQVAPDEDARFQDTTHVERRIIFARRIADYFLNGDKFYDAAAVLIIGRDGSFRHPEDAQLGLLTFAEEVTGSRSPV